MAPMDCDPALIETALDCATAVHRRLGPGLLESVYERALLFELCCSNVQHDAQVNVALQYRGRDLGLGFRADIIIEKTLVLELKSVDKITALHIKQLVTYLKILNIKRGYVLNFNCVLLKHGIRRVSI